MRLVAPVCSTILCLAAMPALAQESQSPGMVILPAGSPPADETDVPASTSAQRDVGGGAVGGDVDEEVEQLRAAMAREVPRQAALDGLNQAHFEADAAPVLSRLPVDHPQLVVLVDRNPAVQLLEVVVVDGRGRFDVIGATHVSTGKPGRREHFQTPVGVFINSTANMGYRALGTYNENHIRGIGLRGMRVWDFGWQSTDNWTSPGYKTDIRLEMHATDPATLEPRIGRPDSE